MQKVRVLITGKVQGVFFRQSACQQAKNLNLNGWIKNLPDGSVLSEAEGLQSSLLHYISWCKKGPARAEVINITIQWLENEGDNMTMPPSQGFSIIA